MIEVLLWVGCLASYFEQNLARSTVEILRQAGDNFTLLGVNEGCCGYPLLAIGYRDEFVNEAKNNVKRISALGVKKLVTICPACFKTFRETYPQIAGSLPFEVTHISEHIMSLIRTGKIKFREMPMTVTYHDPCHLVRDIELYDTPRDVISSIPRIKLVEMNRNKADTYCCGAGGGLTFTFPHLAKKIATTRVKRDVLPTNAEALITSCPACVQYLRFGMIKAVRSKSKRMKVLDLVELAAQALSS